MATEKQDSVVKKKLQTFAKTTSMKGVPRMLQSQAKCIRFMWFCAIVFGITFATYSLTMVFIRYFSYGVAVKIEEVYESPIFPEITLCNLNPLSSAKHGYVYFDQYVEIVKELEDQLERLIEEADGSEIQMDEVFAHLTSVSGYFQNFEVPRLDPDNFTSDLIWSCKLYNWDWTVEDDIDCLQGILKPYWNPHHYVCTTISLTEYMAKRNRTYRGISLIAFLDDRKDMLAMHYNHDMLHSKASGVRLMLHPPDTLPDLKTGINISPGHETSVHITMKERVLESAPYSDCQHMKFLNSTRSSWSSKESPRYEKSACLNLCLQDAILDLCGCLSSDILYSNDYLHKYEFCGNASIPAQAKDTVKESFKDRCLPDIEDSPDMHSQYDEIFERTEGTDHLQEEMGPGSDEANCLEMVLESDSIELISNNAILQQNLNETIQQLLCVSNSGLHDKGCSSLCPEPCYSIEYDKTISQAPWPHWSYQYGFYCSIMLPYINKSQELKTHFKEYVRLFGNCSEEEEYENLFHKTKREMPTVDLKDDFLQLNILFETRSKLKYTTQPSMTWETVFSNMGGTLNLWVGITFITLVEVFELIAEIVQAWVTPRNIKDGGDKVKPMQNTASF